jgi:hypothetical protein
MGTGEGFVTSEALNLEAIARAVHQHALRCPGELTEIRMCPYEADRLDWDAYQGIPIAADSEMGTGRFRLVCEREETRPSAVDARAREGITA